MHHPNRTLARLAFLLAASAAFFPQNPAAAQADTIEVATTVRDFTLTHPDMQRPSLVSFSRQTPGLVATTLDDDGKPVLSVVASLLQSDARQIESAESFAQWYRDVPGVNKTYTRTIEMTRDPETGLYTYERNAESGQSYFPIEGKGPNPDGSDGLDRTTHNYYFTTEIDTSFVYTDPESRDGSPLVLSFLGDDDLWVFMNGQLILDLGGVHSQRGASVNIDEIAESIGLEPGQTYSFRVFHAERYQVESNFKLQTNAPLAPSVIQALYD